MDMYKVALLCVVCFTLIHIQDTQGYCTSAETPSINMCQSGTIDSPSQSIYFDTSGSAPVLSRFECVCALSFSGSGSLQITHRVDSSQDRTKCVNFTVNDRDYDCNQEDSYSTVHQGSNNITFIKTFEVPSSWFSCVKITSVLQLITRVECYPDRPYYAPDEVVNGQFGDWSNTSDCSVTCGAGIQTWVRRCDSPAPRNNGTECLAKDGITRTLVETETRPCNRAACPVNGGWDSWSYTSPCSVTCGSGTRTQTRSCDSPEPQNGGANCLATDGTSVLEESQTVSCTLSACPVNGGWGPWLNTSTCSVTCGSGTRTQTRSCDSPEPQNGGANCLATDGTRVLEESQTVSCTLTACPGPVNGGYTPWSSWSTCTRTCGGGTRDRSRTCTNPAPENNGLPCAGSSSEREDCNTNACPGTGTSQSTESSQTTPTASPTTSSQTTSIASSTQTVSQTSQSTSPTPTGSTDEPPVTQASRDKEGDKINIGAIVGGVIGGLLFLLLLILLICCLCRRRRKKKEEEKPATGPRSVRYVSHGDDVTVTENELYHYDGETPSHATNALFIGGIPETPNSPGYIPHMSTGTGASYAVIMDSNRTKPKSKERPKLDTFNSHEDKGTNEANGDVRASTDTVKLADNYNEDHLGRGVENPGYDENYIKPYDSADGETKPKTSTSSAYDYIDTEKLKRDDAEYENDNLAGDYATLPDDIDNTDAVDMEANDRYKRFISSEPEESPDDGYLKSPKREQTFEFP